MAFAIQNSIPLSVLSNDQDFHTLIKWVESIPVSHVSQDYLALALIIQQEVEPIITKKESQIKMGENILSTEITSSKGFNDHWEFVRSKLIDPTFLPFFNSTETPLPESVLVTRAEEKINKLSRVIFLICRTDKDQSVLESVCQEAIQELTRTKDSIKGSFNVFVQALISDQSSYFPSLTSSSEPGLLENTQDSISHAIERSFEQPVFTLKQREGLLLERHFTHGESVESNTRLSFTLEDGIITTRQTRNSDLSRFTDLRFESEGTFSL